MTKEDKQRVFEPLSRNFETDLFKRLLHGYGRRNSGLYLSRCQARLAANFTMQNSVRHMDRSITYICLIQFLITGCV